jgi:hypothetical protein
MKKRLPLTEAFILGMAVLSMPALALAQPTFIDLKNNWPTYQ